MRSQPLLCAVLLLMSGRAQADLHPETLKPFVLDGSPLLRGFVKARSNIGVFSALASRPPGATGVLNTRYFHGPSDLQCSVFLFPMYPMRSATLQIVLRLLVGVIFLLVICGLLILYNIYTFARDYAAHTRTMSRTTGKAR
jgi:hypothetical protein